jgi:hypothetical protein
VTSKQKTLTELEYLRLFYDLADWGWDSLTKTSREWINWSIEESTSKRVPSKYRITEEENTK